MIDCLIIGFNELSFDDYVNTVRSMGTASGAYRDLSLHFIELDGKPYHSMDILNRFCSRVAGSEQRPLHNADFLWPAITYLVTYLWRRGLSYDYINLVHFQKELLRQKLLDHDIATIAITTTLYVSPAPILEILSFIRQHNRTARIIIGGPYILSQALMLDRAALVDQFKYLDADFYVISPEGESALAQIITAVKQGTGFDRIENLAYKEGDRYVFTATSQEANPLEENMVNYGLFPQAEVGEFVSLRTAKSCPFACAFCGYARRGGAYTYLDVDSVEKELTAIQNIGGVSTLTFVDDTFNVPRRRFKDILRMMIRNGYGFKWNCYYRCDHGDEETIELMKEAGCAGVFLGVESGSDRVLQAMNKTARRKHYLETIPLLKQAGIVTHANLIVGFPGETTESVRETIELIEETKPDFFRAQLWYCDPITPVWTKRAELGIQGSAFEWSHKSMDARTACHWVEEMFLSVENSIWLPQNGFELWSAFYLQRKGMTLAHVKAFLHCFNAMVKDKLVHPYPSRPDPALLASLIESCRFTDAAQPDMRPIEIRSAAVYRAARQFWAAEFAVPIPPLKLGLSYEPTLDADSSRVAAACVFEPSFEDRLRALYQADLSLIYLAAYGVLLARLCGSEDITIATTIRGQGIFPLRLYPCWDMSFRAFVRDLCERTRRAMAHQLYAFYLVTSPLRSASLAAYSPIFEAGFAFRGQEAEGEEIELGALRTQSPALGEMALGLEVSAGQDGTTAHFSYWQESVAGEMIGKLTDYLTAILRAAQSNPDVLLGDIVLDSTAPGQVSATVPGSTEAFNFAEL